MGDIYVKPGGGGADSDELTANKDDVLKGKTAVTHDSDGESVSGTLELTGNITAADIRKGKTGYSANPKSKITGTQEDRGAWVGSVGMNGSVTVPGGIHSGGGKVNGPAVTQRGAWTGSVGMNGSVAVPEGYHNGQGRVNGPAVTQRGNLAKTLAINETFWLPEGYYSGGYVNQGIGTLGEFNITPSTSEQMIWCSGKYMTGNVKINAIPSNYVDVTNGMMVFNNGTVHPLLGGIKSILGDSAYGNPRIENGVIKFVPIRHGYNGKIFGFSKSVDLTPFKTIRAYFDYGELIKEDRPDHIESFIGITKKNCATLQGGGSYDSNNLGVIAYVSDTQKTDYMTLDIPEYTGQYFICITSNTSSSQKPWHSMYCTKVELLP